MNHSLNSERGTFIGNVSLNQLLKGHYRGISVNIIREYFFHLPQVTPAKTLKGGPISGLVFKPKSMDESAFSYLFETKREKNPHLLSGPETQA